MSEARFDRNVDATGHTDVGTASVVKRAIDRLNGAQEVVDMLDRPDIGARLRQVIDSLEDIQREN
jgi:hypothetical protein